MSAPHSILMVRPKHFGYNLETAQSNSFQHKEHGQCVSQSALAEFDQAVSQLKAANIDVLVLDDTDNPIKPDAIFPNNWFSTHHNGSLILYPMMARNRRPERRPEFISILRQKYQIECVLDLSTYEEDGFFLEGTGSIVFDHVAQKAYASVSPRTHLKVLETVCKHLNYKPISFQAKDLQGQDIYHTNVIMSIGKQFAVVCLDCIEDILERAMLKKALLLAGKDIINISYNQLKNFAGNCLEVADSQNKSHLILSNTAYNSLSSAQIERIETYTNIISISINTIENIGGGSIRCMMAGIHLPKKA